MISQGSSCELPHDNTQSEIVTFSDLTPNTSLKSEPDSCPNAPRSGQQAHNNDICGDRVMLVPDGARAYDFEGNTNWRNTFTKTVSLDRGGPNLHGYFPVNGTPTSIWSPYLFPALQSVNKIINNYNPFDNLVGQPIPRPTPNGKADPVIYDYRGGAWRVGQWSKQHTNILSFHPWSFEKSRWELSDFSAEPPVSDRLRLFYKNFDFTTDPIHLISDYYYDNDHNFVDLFDRQQRYRILALYSQGFMGTVGATPGLFVGTPGSPDDTGGTDSDLRPRFRLCDKTQFEIAARVHHSGPWRSYSAQRYLFWRGMVNDLVTQSSALDQLVNHVRVWDQVQVDPATKLMQQHCTGNNGP